MPDACLMFIKYTTKMFVYNSALAQNHLKPVNVYAAVRRLKIANEKHENSIELKAMVVYV